MLAEKGKGWASAAASAIRRSINDVMRPLTFLNGSSPNFPALHQHLNLRRKLFKRLGMVLLSEVLDEADDLRLSKICARSKA